MYTIQQKFIMLCALGTSISLSALRGDIAGKNPGFQTKRVKTSHLREVLGARKRAAKKSVSCPTIPPISNFIVPTQNPNAPAVAFYPNAAATNSPQTSPQTIGALAIKDQATCPMPFEAPFNVAMCVGLEQVLFTAESFIESFDRNLVPDNILHTLFNAFINLDGDFSFYNNGLEVDMRYDKFNNCFFFAQETFSEFGSEFNGGILFGVSDSGIISEDTTWTVVNISDITLVPDANGCPGDVTPDGVTPDFCRVGVDQNAYYFVIDILDATNGNWISSTAFVLNKQGLLSDEPVGLTVFRDVPGYPGYPNTTYRLASTTLMTTMNFDADPEFGYFIGQDPLYWGKFNLYRVLNPASANPTISAVVPIDVPTTGIVASSATIAPFAGNQYGSLGNLYALDDELKMCHIRNKQLFTVHTVLVDSTGVSSVNGDRYGIRWYQFDLTGDATGNAGNIETVSTVPALVQAGTLFDPSTVNPIWYFLPAIMTNKNGDLSLSGVLSGATQSLSAFNVGRLAGDPLGVLRIGASPVTSVYQQGSGPFTQGLGTVSELGIGTVSFGQRISDRSYTCFDPVDDVTMWAAQQFIQDGKLQWAIARLDAPTI